MCTVSFVNTNGKIIITSNRDEKIARDVAIEPKNYLVNNKNIFFPKDKKAGGTWFAVNENATVLVLLNGAIEKHLIKENYRKSRGLIVLELISSESVINSWKNIDLQNIEPFTLVVFENQELYQLQWNEILKTSSKLDSNKSHIWSSSTLYNKEIREKRANWFHDFMNEKSNISGNKMLEFHQYTENDNLEHGLIINRNNALKTLSITQTVIEKNKVQISYQDLILDKQFVNTFITI